MFYTKDTLQVTGKARVTIFFFTSTVQLQQQTSKQIISIEYKCYNRSNIEYDKNSKRWPPRRCYMQVIIKKRKINQPGRKECILNLLGRGSNCTKIILSNDGLDLEDCPHTLLVMVDYKNGHRFFPLHPSLHNVRLHISR